MEQQIFIEPEFKSLIPPLSADEYQQLEQNLLADGCRDPLVLWHDVLIDGHNRYEICQRHGIPFQTVQKDFATLDEAYIWVAKNQLGRRNITDFVRAELALMVKPALAEQAKERMQAGKSDPTQIFAEGTGETNDAVAELAGVSRETVRKVEKVLKEAPAEVVEKARTGEISINAAAKTIQAESKPAKVKKTEASKPATQDNKEHFGPSEAEIQQALADERAEIEALRRIAESDDRIKAALEEVRRVRELNRVLESRLQGQQNTINEQIRTIKALKSKLQKLEQAA